MAGFIYRKNLDGSNAVPSHLHMIAKDAIIFTVGDVVRLNTSGFIDLAEANEQVIGVVQGVVDSKGIPVEPDSGTQNTWTMPSANSSTELYMVEFIPAFAHYAFSTDSDTTITAADLGQYFNVSSTSDSIVTSGQSYTIGTLMFQCIGLDPNSDGDASMGLYRCVGSQMGQTTIAAGAA